MNYLNEVAEVLHRIPRHQITKALEVLIKAKDEGVTVFTFGNGGSAATASHFANDLTKMAGLKAICLSDMTPTILAYGNDDGWEYMFANALRDLSVPGDVFVAISCSGRSKNILQVASVSEFNQVIALTGEAENNPLLAFAHAPITVPHPDIRTQEDCHLVICHALAGQLRDIDG